MDELIKNIISEEIDLKKEEEIEEIVDGKGNIMTSKKTDRFKHERYYSKENNRSS